MSAHVGITSFPAGVSVPTGATAQSLKETSTVEIAKLPGEDGEWKKATPHKSYKHEATLEVIGAIDPSAVTPAVVSAPATLTLMTASQKQNNKERPTGTLNYSGVAAFVDGGTSGSGAGAGSANEDTMGLVSTTLALAETTDVTFKIDEKTAFTPAGAPGYRQTHAAENEGAINGKGDLPSGLGLGTGGGALADFSGGVLIVPSIEKEQKAHDLNTYSGKINHFPVAVAAD